MTRPLFITISLIVALSASAPLCAQSVATLVVTGHAMQANDGTVARLSGDGTEHTGTAAATHTATTAATPSPSSGFLSDMGAMVERIVASVTETVSRGVNAIVSLFTSHEPAPVAAPSTEPATPERQAAPRPVDVAPVPVMQRPEPASSAPVATAPVHRESETTAAAAASIPHVTEAPPIPVHAPAPAPAPTGAVRRDVLGYAAVEAGPKVEPSTHSATLPESGSHTTSKDSAPRASTSTRDVLGYGAVDIRDTSPDSQTKGNAMVASAPQAAPQATVREESQLMQARTESAPTSAIPTSTATSTPSADREVYTAPFMDRFVAQIEERPPTTTSTASRETSARETGTTSRTEATPTAERQAVTTPETTTERPPETTERTSTTTEREAYTAERPTTTDERTPERSTETSERQVASTEPQPTTERTTTDSATATERPTTTETASRETTTTESTRTETTNTETASRETSTTEPASTETTTASREASTIDCRDPINAKNPSCTADPRCVNDAFVQANPELCRCHIREYALAHVDECHPGPEVAMVEPGEGKRSVTEGEQTGDSKFKSKIFDISNMKELILPMGRVLRAKVLEGKSFQDQVVMLMGIVRGQKALLILDPFSLKATMCTLDRSSPFMEPVFGKKDEIPVMSFGEGKVLLNPAEFFRKMLQVRGVELRDVVARACDVDSDLKEFNAVVETDSLSKPLVSDLVTTLKEEAKLGVGDEAFGLKLSEQIKDEVVLDAKFKAVTEFGKSPNAMVATTSGNSFYTRDDAGNAVLDAEEVLPKGERLVFADQNNFGGPDLFLIAHRGGQAVMSVLTNQNNPPQVEKVEVTGDNIQLSAVVRTEPGEDLVYKWVLNQEVNGQMVDRTAYLSNPAVENPKINWPTLQTAPAGDVSVNESVAIAIPIYKSTGVSTESAHKYVATLTVTDPAGASASGDISMSMSLSKAALTIPGATTGTGLMAHGEAGPSGPGTQALSGTEAPSGAEGHQAVWGLEGGGCSLSRPTTFRNWTSLLPAALLLIPLLIVIPARVRSRIRKK